MAMLKPELEKAAEAARRDAALSVACLVCLVLAGERCLNTVTGEPCNLVHGGRVARWENEARPDPPEYQHPEDDQAEQDSMNAEPDWRGDDEWFERAW